MPEEKKESKVKQNLRKRKAIGDGKGKDKGKRAAKRAKNAKY